MEQSIQGTYKSTNKIVQYACILLYLVGARTLVRHTSANVRAHEKLQI